MPEAVAGFVAEKSFLAAARCHEALGASFKEDFGKYSGHSEAERLRSLWDRLPFEAGARINYARLGGQESGSREVSRAFDILHDAMLVPRNG